MLSARRFAHAGLRDANGCRYFDGQTSMRRLLRDGFYETEVSAVRTKPQALFLLAPRTSSHGCVERRPKGFQITSADFRQPPERRIPFIFPPIFITFGHYRDSQKYLPNHEIPSISHNYFPINATAELAASVSPPNRKCLAHRSSPQLRFLHEGLPILDSGDTSRMAGFDRLDHTNSYCVDFPANKRGTFEHEGSQWHTLPSD